MLRPGNVQSAHDWHEVLNLRAADLTSNGAVYHNVRTEGGVERRMFCATVQPSSAGRLEPALKT